MTPHLDEQARELAEWLHEKLCCAQNLPWEEGDICDDCVESVKTEVLPLLARVRLALLNEMAAEECPACKDGAELFRDEESGEWAHERPGLPNFLCEVPEVIAARIASLRQAAGENKDATKKDV